MGITTCRLEGPVDFYSVVQFPSWLVTIIIAAMVVGSLVLAPSIVFAYGVKAADAEDRGEKFGY